MNSPYDDGAMDPPGLSWFTVVRRIIPFVFFLILAAGGMFAVYLFFSPADSDADGIGASLRLNSALSTSDVAIVATAM